MPCRWTKVCVCDARAMQIHVDDTAEGTHLYALDPTHSSHVIVYILCSTRACIRPCIMMAGTNIEVNLW
jgi:hypothetical protein